MVDEMVFEVDFLVLVADVVFWFWVVASLAVDFLMVLLLFLNEHSHSKHAKVVQTHLLIAGMKDVVDEMVFEVAFLVLEANVLFCILGQKNDIHASNAIALSE